VKIISLRASNFMKLVAVNISPTGNLVEITGKNGQGKSSVLHAIWIAFRGLSVKQNDTKLTVPIRKGAEEARIRIDCGEMVVTREFKLRDGGDYTTSVKVENADGSRFPSPQDMLDKLLGELCFDPLAFARMKAEDQFEALRRFVPGVDFDAIDKANDADFEKRKGINKRQKEAAAAAAAMTLSTTPPCAAIDESALVAELESAGEKNTNRERSLASREKAVAKIQLLREQTAGAQSRIDEMKANEMARYEATERMYEQQTAELQRQIAQLRDRLGEAHTSMQSAIETEEKRIRAEADRLQAETVALQTTLDGLGVLAHVIDTAALRTRISAARESNQRLAQWTADNKKRTDLRQLAETLAKESQALTKAMDKRDADKDAAIAAAKMPVEGIGFGKGIVLLDGLPFDQASDAQRLQASVKIAMAGSPTLRVIRIRDGSLLDDDAMQQLAEMADANDMQIWIERVGTSDRVGFVLEDGHVRGQSDEPPADPVPESADVSAPDLAGWRT
jgi:hypothetical protein